MRSLGPSKAEKKNLKKNLGKGLFETHSRLSKMFKTSSRHWHWAAAKGA